MLAEESLRADLALKVQLVGVLLRHVPLDEVKAELLIAILALHLDMLLLVVLLDPVRLWVPILALGTLLRIVGIKFAGFWLGTARR